MEGAVLWRGKRSHSVRPAQQGGSLETDETQCFSICPAGYYKKSNGNCGEGRIHCSPCERGTFTQTDNKVLRCLLCTTCDEKVSKVEEKPCSITSDTTCGCREGYLRHDHSGNQEFECKRRTTTHSTMTASSAATSFQTTVSTKGTTKRTPEISPNQDPLVGHVVVLILTLVVLLGTSMALLLCCCAQLGGFPYHWILERCLVKPKLMHSTAQLPQDMPSSAPPSQSCDRCEVQVPLASSNNATSQVRAPLNNNEEIDRARLLHQADLQVLKDDPSSCDWPAPVLYAVIRTVPVRRWKEFLRLLRVPDGQMERVELEAGPNYLEQQYQMLRLWSQRGGVQLADVYMALQSMDLSGCAQELRVELERLQ